MRFSIINHSRTLIHVIKFVKDNIKLEGDNFNIKHIILYIVVQCTYKRKPNKNNSLDRLLSTKSNVDVDSRFVCNQDVQKQKISKEGED